MKTLTLTLDDFARLFGTDAADLPPPCQKIARERDFRYRRMEQEERDRLIGNILKRIDSGDLTVAGAHRRPDWERGWAENLEQYCRTGDLSALTPKFIRPDQAIRLDRDYVIPESDSFEFDFVDVLRRWLFHKYFADKAAVYEFGCGSCQHLVALAEIFPEKRLYGLDWASSSLAIIDRLVAVNRWNMTGRLFNLFQPDESLQLENDSAVFTVGTMEQMGRDFEPFLRFLSSSRAAICLHLETIRELYDDNNLLDYLAIRFDSRRGYLNGFLTRLRELEKEGIVEIIAAQRIFFGSLYHDGYSIVAWRPKRHDS